MLSKIKAYDFIYSKIDGRADSTKWRCDHARASTSAVIAPMIVRCKIPVSQGKEKKG